MVTTGEEDSDAGLVEEHKRTRTNDNEDSKVPPVKDSEVVHSVNVLDRFLGNAQIARGCRDIIQDSYGKLKATKEQLEEQAKKAGRAANTAMDGGYDIKELDQFATQAEMAWKAANAAMDGGDDIETSIKELGNDIEDLKELILRLCNEEKTLMELTTPRDVALSKFVATAVAMSVKSVPKSAEVLAKTAGEMANAAEKTHTLLNHLSTLGNKSEFSKSYSRTGGTTRNLERQETRGEDCTSTIERLLRNRTTLELSGECNNEAMVTLMDFSQFLISIVSSADMINAAMLKAAKNDPGEEKINATVNAIANYLAKDSDPNDHAGAKAYGKPVPAGQEVQYGIPVPPGLEVRGVQPILTAIIRKVASFVEDSRIKTSVTSPSRGVQNERSIAPVQNGEGEPRGGSRRVDATIHKDQKAWRGEVRSLLPLTAEYKPLGRKGKNVFDLLDEGRDQQLGHMAKRILSAFNFGGVGVDGHCTGVVMTLASVEVLQLRFERETFSVELLSTDPLPLFPKECVEKLFEGEANKEDTCVSFLEQLFPAPNVQDGIPAGLVMLWKLLNTSSSDLSSDYWKGGMYLRDDNLEGPEKLKLEERLGSGTFGTVYSVCGDKSVVVKVVQSNLISSSIENEIQVLKELGKTCHHIPIFKSHGNVCVSIRGRKVQLTAMLTSPKGDYNTHELAVLHMLEERDLSRIASDVGAALKAAQGKGFSHLDVRPSNIMRTNDDKGKYYYVLVDWGCAKKNHEEVRGFVGSTYYAHSEIHKTCEVKHTWKPIELFDRASLLYTLVVLYCRGHILWRNSGELLLERRNIEVDNIVKKWKSKGNSPDNLDDLIDAANWKKSSLQLIL